MDNIPIVIVGSAREDSDTKKLVREVFPAGTANVVDLLEYKLYAYSYSGRYPADDQFLQLIEELLVHRQIVFATPVYWYAMSGLMKNFFDRLTDIVTVQKNLGRKLAGKETFLLAVGAEEELPAGFEMPFELTSDYFAMHYRACYYCRTKAIKVPSGSRDSFIKELNKTRKTSKT